MKTISTFSTQFLIFRPFFVLFCIIFLLHSERNLIAEFLDNDPKRSLDGLLGPMPAKNNIFRGLHFILTCTIPMKKARKIKVCEHENTLIGSEFDY